MSVRASWLEGGEENEQMDVGEDWVCFDVEKEYGGEEGEVLWQHRQNKQCRLQKRLIQGEDGRQAAKGQTCKDLVPGFKTGQ